jgi:hypothetical protein
MHNVSEGKIHMHACKQLQFLILTY